MKFKKSLLFLSIILVACEDDSIEPFILTVSDYNYSLAYSVLYRLTDKKLTITFRGELEGERDSLLYSTTNLPKQKVRRISKINLDSLGVLYMNNCVADGDVKVFGFKKDSIVKGIQLNNYYHPDLSPVIELINYIVPEKFAISYNKDDLIRKMENCDHFTIKRNWDHLDSLK